MKQTATFDIFDLPEQYTSPYTRLGRNRHATVTHAMPFLEHLRRLPEETPIQTRNPYLPLETTRRLIDRLKRLGILTPIDNTYSFYTPQSHNRPKPRTYRIDHNGLKCLLRDYETHTRQKKALLLHATTSAIQKNQIDTLLTLLLQKPENDRPHIHDAILYALRPELRKTYLEGLNQKKQPPLLPDKN